MEVPLRVRVFTLGVHTLIQTLPEDQILPVVTTRGLDASYRLLPFVRYEVVVDGIL